MVQGLSARRATAAKAVALEELLPELVADARIIYANPGCEASSLFAASTADVVDWAYYFLDGVLMLRQGSEVRMSLLSTLSAYH